MCPLIKLDCIEVECKFWLASENECVILNTNRILHLAKEDYLTPMRAKIERIKD